MTPIKPTRTLALLLTSMTLLAGCSDTGSATTKNSISSIKSALKKAHKTDNLHTQILLLRTAYDAFQPLKAATPPTEKTIHFMAQYGTKLQGIPQHVHALSMQARDIDSFKWAVERRENAEISYAELINIWNMGKQWRDYFMTRYPEKSRSIFMSEAVNYSSVRFFNQYIGDFKADDYRLEFPLEKTEFNSRFCHFFAEMFKTAMEENDAARIQFLMEYMPPLHSVRYVNLETEAVMRSLAEYVFFQLRDEALACQLVALGYDMNRIDLTQLEFGAPFQQALEADPSYAILHLLKLHEWQAPLSSLEAEFLRPLSPSMLRLVHPLHTKEAIGFFVKNGHTESALKLIQLRQETQPMTSYDYTQLLGWALESNNRAIFDYVRTTSGTLNIFSLDLAQLAGSQKLFEFYAPKILKKIYRTMDQEPKTDGTTFGRIHALFTSNRPEAVLYIVKNYNFGPAWKQVTQGRTLLMDICEGGNLAAAQYLILKKGANLHEQTGYMELKISILGRTKSKEGKLSPLFFAAKSGNSDLIQFLASQGARINARSSYGATPLMYAVGEGHVEAVETLIALGANVRATMNQNLTRTELAEMGHYTEISTAYRRAKKIDHKKIMALLEQAGARP